jgi:hypothetical protein
VGRPLDIVDGSTWAQNTNPFGGAPLLLTVGSASTSEQTIALTTQGLYAWGTEGAVLNAAVKVGAGAGVLNVTGGTNGMPPGVAPDDVAQIFATNKLLALVTKLDKGGQVWMLVNPSLGAGRFNLRGDGSSDTTTDNQWHRVRTNAAGNPVLQNVRAVRGQVADTNRGALMAHTDDGKLYAWGSTPYFGDGNSASPEPYATPMTLPQVGVIDITPKMIGVTGNGSANNTMFVLSDAGTLYSVGANNQYQLGAGLVTAQELNWQTVQIGVAGGGISLVGDVDFFSVQEHDAGASNGGAAGALITKDGTVYTWGTNNGNMIAGAGGTTGLFHVAKPDYVGGASAEQKARLVEVGGHTTVFLPQSSPQFCYVGHQTQGSMGDGVIAAAYQTGFNCSATPVLNICGASGFDYGDAPKGYENGGGSNQAMHFYANGGSNPNDNKLFLGFSAPQQNDATPKNVVSGTKNVGEYGDYIASPAVILEEDGIIETSVDGGGAWTMLATLGDELPPIEDTTTDYRLRVRYTNTTVDGSSNPVAGTIHAWVDWNNDGIFQTAEYATAPATANTANGTATLTWSGLLGLEEGYRYIRLRITTKTTGASVPYNSRFPAENVTVRTEGGLTEDSRSLGFAMDGEIEDHRVRVVKSGGADNVPPVAIDVTTAPVGLGTAPQRLLLPATSNPAPMDGSDGDGTVVAYRIMTLPTNGTLYYLDGALPMPITSIPPGGLPVEATTELWYSGTDAATATFTFKAIDDDSDESANTATYTIPKVLIDAVNDTATVLTGTTSIATNVAGNDKSETYDTSGNVTGSPAYTVTSSTNGSKGSVSCTAAGVCTYTPTNPSLAGSDSYEYTICLTAAPTVCDTATVAVTLSPLTITPVNDVTNTAPGVAVDIPVMQNDRGDAALDPGSVATTVTTIPTKGSVSCSVTTGVCTYTPADNLQTGEDKFSYKVCLVAPNDGVCKEATVTVNISATGVVATDDVTNTQQGVAKTIPVRQNDTATGGTIDPNNVVVTSGPANGTVDCSSGDCIYTPAGGFTGTDRFTYKVCLAAPADTTVCDEALVTVEVSATGGPVLDAFDDTASTTTGTGVNVPVTINDVVTGGGTIDPNSVVSTSGPASGTVDCTTTPGVCRYTPNPGFTGEDSFTYRVCLQTPAAICDEAVVRVKVGAPSLAAIPTLSEWGVMILSALMGLFMAGAYRRRMR